MGNLPSGETKSDEFKKQTKILPMKFLCYVIIILSLHSCQEKSNKEASATPNSAAKEQSAETLQIIKSEEDIGISYDQIIQKVQNKVVDSTSFNYDCNGERSGKVSYFSENGELLLIKHTYNEYSHFSASDNYFIKDGKPFFVLSSQTVWSFLDQNQTKDQLTEKRLYIINEQPIKCLQKELSLITNSKNVSKTDTISNKEIECSDYASRIKDFKALLKLKDKKGTINCLEGISKKK